MPRDNKIWDERSRPALIPKWGSVRCDLLDQDAGGEADDCATYAVAQCLLAMGVVDDWETGLVAGRIFKEVAFACADPTSIGDNLYPDPPPPPPKRVLKEDLRIFQKKDD